MSNTIQREGSGGREVLEGGGEKKMENRQIDNKKTKKVRIATGYHRLLRKEAADSGRTIKEVLEGYIVEMLGVIDEKQE